MTQPEGPPPPAQPKRAKTFASSSQLTDLSSLHSRAPRRKTSAQSLSSSHSRSPAPGRQPVDRRASTFSLSSIDELTADLINPSFTRPHREEEEGEDEVTNWHSTPLLFALLPAVGGVLFKEGAAVVTDLLILGLAAIFLNWSVRLPWDWYYAAQMVVRGKVEEGLDGDEDEGAILEEDGEEDHDTEQNGASEATEPTSKESKDRMTAVSERREEAMRNLRAQETVALLSTFVFPALAAYLLHVLRGQLSQSSTGLVSDYNLSVFLLVAEIRPCRHLIRLIKRRTLHLQRSITGSDEMAFAPSKSSIAALVCRIGELEHRLSEQQPSNPTMNGHQKSPIDDLSSEMKKRYESRIDALERAVRRYEKRTTTLAMVTEQRLKTLDVRMNDTLSLAAVAAQQSRQRSAAGRMVDMLLALVLMPLQMLLGVVVWPVRALEGLYERLMGLLFGRPKGSRKAGKRAGEVRVEKGRDRVAERKADVVR